ncbi:hypothetical protein OIU84_011618 [Salix udensis]|uniref:Mitochondrial fission 1 protein n=1 Tax=Salix udensis TaxID=889485 RepID=A0AAD6JNA9_9ROSI|nr:hypothetical protein OIU84_011618 [Salix udensis]
MLSLELKTLLFAASLANSSPPLLDREKIYLLAVGYYRSGEYSRSRQLVDQCLEALDLKKTLEDRVSEKACSCVEFLLSLKADNIYLNKFHRDLSKQYRNLFCENADGVIGIGITATAVGLIAGGIAAALARKK